MLTTIRKLPSKVPAYSEHFHEKLSSACISLVILFTLGAQYYSSFGVGFVSRRFPLFEATRSPNLWPFISYPLYTAPHHVGEVLDQYSLFGILEDSSTVKIDADDLGVCIWHLGTFVDSIRNDDSELTGQMVEWWEKRHSRKLIGLRLENHRLVFAGATVEEGPRQLPKTVTLPLAKDPPR